jgi:hypothetical protein
MKRTDRQRGEGRLGFIITLALFIAGAFVAYKILPARISGYQFRDALRDEARYASVHRDDKETRNRILEHAKSLDIPLDPADLTIRRSSKEVVIRARYEQPIDLKVTTYTYRFDAEQSSPIF